jgi:hypothetical protein
VNTIEDSYATLLERQPSDKERQALLRTRDALNLKSNDALWLVLMVLGYYETAYARFPSLIAKAATEVMEKAKATAEGELKAAAARTRAELAKSVAQTAYDIADRTASANRLQWVVVCLIGLGVMFLSIGIASYRAGRNAGEASGYDRGLGESRDLWAHAAWANTPEGRLGYDLAKAGSLRDVATCSGKVLVRKGNECFVKAGKAPVYGWKVPPEVTAGPSPTNP